MQSRDEVRRAHENAERFAQLKREAAEVSEELARVLERYPSVDSDASDVAIPDSLRSAFDELDASSRPSRPTRLARAIRG